MVPIWKVILKADIEIRLDLRWWNVEINHSVSCNCSYCVRLEILSQVGIVWYLRAIYDIELNIYTYKAFRVSKTNTRIWFAFFSVNIWVLIFTNSAPLGRVGHRVGMSVYLSGCLSAPSGAVFSEASHWPWDHMISSRPLIGPPSLPPLETWKFGNLETQ